MRPPGFLKLWQQKSLVQWKSYKRIALSMNYGNLGALTLLTFKVTKTRRQCVWVVVKVGKKSLFYQKLTQGTDAKSSPISHSLLARGSAVLCVKEHELGPI